MKVLKDLVWEILRTNELSRSDDKELLQAVWEEQGFKFTPDQKYLFKKVAHPETITRIRREIQAEGIFKATPLKRAQRNLFEMKTREKYRE